MKSLVIPSAGFAKRLYPLSQNTPKVLIKLNGVPLFHIFYKQALEMQMDNIIIVINPEFKRQLQEFLEDTYQNAEIPIYVVEVKDRTAGVLHSVYCGINSKYCKKEALIILSDTVYTEKLPTNKEKSFVYYSPVTKPYSRWCLVATDEFSKVKQFHDKPQQQINTDKALIGIYNLKKSIFINCCKEIFKTKVKHRGEYQLSQALELYKDKEDLFAIKAKEEAWHDTGTLDNLRQASLNFFLSRKFNNVKIDKGILKKSSTDIKKLKNEYLWYKTVNLKHLTPTVYSFKDYCQRAELTMELCSLADLGTIFNYSNAEPAFFQQVVAYILQQMDKYFYQQKGNLNKKDNIHMFIDKLEKRATAQVKNNKYYNSLVKELKEIVTPSYPVIIHGDLILSNILFEPQRMVMKLVDPRGEYGNLNVYGDIRYDLAKLLHSLDGKYETIVHELYIIKNNQIKFYMNKSKQACFQSAEKEIFKFAKSKGIEPRELKAIEASLYWSMIPLHQDSPKRQKAFYLTGERICKELYNG